MKIAAIKAEIKEYEWMPGCPMMKKGDFFPLPALPSGNLT